MDKLTLAQLYEMRAINKKYAMSKASLAIDDAFLIEINKRLNQPGPIKQSLT